MTAPPKVVVCYICGEAGRRRSVFQRTCGEAACKKEHRRRERAKEYAKQYAEDPERLRAERRRYYRENRERDLARLRLRNYGMTDAKLQDLLRAQGGNCPVCRELLEWPRVAVDHCHVSGRVRGLLQGVCNSGIGLLGDDPERCTRAAAYLRAAAPSSQGGQPS